MNGEFSETDDIEGLKGEHTDSPSTTPDGQKRTTVPKEWRPSAATIAAISGIKEPATEIEEKKENPTGSKTEVLPQTPKP